MKELSIKAKKVLVFIYGMFYCLLLLTCLFPLFSYKSSIGYPPGTIVFWGRYIILNTFSYLGGFLWLILFPISIFNIYRTKLKPAIISGIIGVITLIISMVSVFWVILLASELVFYVIGYIMFVSFFGLISINIALIIYYVHLKKAN